MNQRLKFSLYVTLVLLATIAVCAAQADPQSGSITSTPAAGPAATATPAEPQFQEHYPRYVLRESDVFDINFDLSPEFNQAGVAVQPDGYITLRGVGDVRVVGQSVTQLVATLRQAYSKVLHDPIISIVLKDFQKPYFIADGQLGKPGKYELRGDVTLTEAIAMAGGFLDSSKHSQVLLFRRVNDQWSSARIINVKEMEKQGNLKEDPFLRAGDMLFVPKNFMSKIRPFVPNSGVSVAAFNRQY
jgi:polysaccharide export outer membrane protein